MAAGNKNRLFREEEKNLKLSPNFEYDLQIPVFCFHVENIKQTFFINGPRGFLRGTQSVFDEFTHELYLYLQNYFKRRCLGGHQPYPDIPLCVSKIGLCWRETWKQMRTYFRFSWRSCSQHAIIAECVCTAVQQYIASIDL